MPENNNRAYASLQRVALNTLITLAVILTVFTLLGFMYLILHVLLQLLLASFVSIALIPLVRWFEKRGFSTTLASFCALLLTLVISFVVIGAIISPLITQGNQLLKNAPHIIDTITNNSTFHNLNNRFHVLDKVKQTINNVPTVLAGNQGAVLGTLGSIFGTLSEVALIMIMSLFILVEGPQLWAKFTSAIGSKRAKSANRIATEVSSGIGGFVTGNLLISVIAAAVSLITLLLLHVPYAMALAALVAVFDLIPLIGAGLATIILGLVALTQGVWIAIIVIAVMMAYQFVEGHFIQPVIYSRTVKLSQLTILIASIMGAELGGILGILLAIPAASIVSIFLTELYSIVFHTNHD
jgi:predicted PurR-regulated permease PerM